MSSRTTTWIERSLTQRRLPLALALLAFALCLPALFSGWRMDDYYHRAAFLHTSALSGLRGAMPEASPADLFRFSDGDPNHVRAALELGTFPWWTCPEWRAQFFRPLAALTHWLDYCLWPDSAPLMHLQSLLWFAALVYVAAVFYRRLLGRTTTAGLAALLFAVDPTHATAAGWIANRNALPAALFGMLSFLAYERWRRENWRPGAFFAPPLFALSLLSAEAGVATAALLLSHACFLDRAPWRRRALALLPLGVVAVSWRLLAVRMGVGTYAVSLYVDPGATPLRFLVAVGQRLPVLLLGQWGPIPSDLSYVLRPEFYRILWLLGLVVAGAVAALLLPLLRRDPRARFFGAAMLLAMVPVCAAFPDDRLLLFSGLGAWGLLALLTDQKRIGEPVPATEGSSRAGRSRVVRFGVRALIAIHLVAAPFLLPMRVQGWGGLEASVDLPAPRSPSIGRQSVVIVSSPLALLAACLPVIRGTEGKPVPAHVRVLSPSLCRVRLSRPDARTLVVAPRGGFLALPVDTLFRNSSCALHLSDHVELADVSIEVTRMTPDAHPHEVTCHFRAPLEDPSLVWLCWKDGEFQPFTPPPVGGTVTLPAPIPFLPAR